MRCNHLFYDCVHCRIWTTGLGFRILWVLSSFETTWLMDPSTSEHWPIQILRWRYWRCLAMLTLPLIWLFIYVGCGICHDSCFLSFSRLLIGLSLSLFSFFVTYNSFFWECLSRYVESSSYITYAQARDKTSFMVMHWYFISYLYRFRAMEHAEALSTGWIHFFSRIVLYSYTVIQLDVVASRKEIVGHLF